MSFLFGNLSVGGTGKTPMVAYLIEHFIEKGLNVATLSRGYGRKTKGFKICGVEDTPKTVGDEPYSFFARYGDKITVAVWRRSGLSNSIHFGRKTRCRCHLVRRCVPTSFS